MFQNNEFYTHNSIWYGVCELEDMKFGRWKSRNGVSRCD